MFSSRHLDRAVEQTRCESQSTDAVVAVARCVEPLAQRRAKRSHSNEIVIDKRVRTQQKITTPDCCVCVTSLRTAIARAASSCDEGHCRCAAQAIAKARASTRIAGSMSCASSGSSNCTVANMRQQGNHQHQLCLNGFFSLPERRIRGQHRTVRAHR